MAIETKCIFLVAIALLVLLPGKADAFGAGNIASISKVEGKNWRHGDIEDMLATVACLRGHKWNSMMIKVTIVIYKLTVPAMLISAHSAHTLVTGSATTVRYECF
jgi:hypothetical protein